MTGCLFAAFPLIYITTRKHSHFDIARVVTAALTFTAYLILYIGNTKKIRWMYWFYFVIMGPLLIMWLVASIMSIYFAGVLIDRLLHPEAMESQLNIWWIIYVAALMSNSPQDFGRQNAEVPGK